MEQEKSAREILAYIERNLFKGIDLDKASRLEGEERRTYRLSQVERLLAEKHGSVALAVYLSDMFWTADEGRKLPEHPNPLLSLKDQQMLTKEEMDRLRLILEIAGLCHDLSQHFVFDLTEAFGIKNRFWIDNKQLFEWLTTTEYEWIAMHTAFLLRKHAINVFIDSYYQPAQDGMAELFSREHRELIRHPDNTEIPHRDYVKTILNELLRIDRHWKRGHKLKLDPEVVILHDEIYGLIPLQFDKVILQAAQELYDYMDAELQGKFLAKGLRPNVMWRNQPKSVHRAADELLGHFAEKVREVRSKYLAKGWVEDVSLAFGYLMAHAERCLLGNWRNVSMY